jgi:hypothetical protein
VNKKLKKFQNKRYYKRETLAVIAVAILGAAAILYMFLQPNESSAAEHLVTFYDRGAEQSVLTRASTVGEALKAAGIEVDPNDIIDPTIDTRFTTSYVDVIIYRSRPVAVADGNIRQTVMTPVQSPNEILKAANLQALGAEDKATFSYDTTGTKGMIVLNVERAKLEPQRAVFVPKPNALTRSKGAHVFVDSSGVAHRETYYDLPMNIVIRACGPNGSYTVRSDGAKIDQDGYVLVAAGLSAYPRCTIVETSLGPGKVYDTGGFALRHPYGFDLATDWTNYNGL